MFIALFEFAFLALAATMVVRILILVNLQHTLERVSPDNRAMTPGLVWLQLIPLFGYFWAFYTVVKVRDSVRAEYRARGWPVDGDFGLNIGIAAGALTVIGFGALGIPPDRRIAVSFVLALGSMICWIIYWARTAGFKNRLGPPKWAPYGPFPVSGPYPPPPFDAGLDLAESAEGTLLCPVCASTVREPDRFCYVCGARLPWSDY